MNTELSLQPEMQGGTWYKVKFRYTSLRWMPLSRLDTETVKPKMTLLPTSATLMMMIRMDGTPIQAITMMTTEEY